MLNTKGYLSIPVKNYFGEKDWNVTRSKTAQAGLNTKPPRKLVIKMSLKFSKILVKTNVVFLHPIFSQCLPRNQPSHPPCHSELYCTTSKAEVQLPH